MSPIRLVLILVIAAVAALGLAFVFRSLTATKPAAAVAAAPAAPVISMARVLVAKHDLAIGARIMPADVDWQPWPTAALNPNFISDGVQPVANTGAPATVVRQAGQAASDMIGASPAIAALDGSIVREAIKAGEPIMTTKLVRGGEGGYMSVVLEPGMRAMSLPVTVETGAGGFILPGDRVDVLTSRQSRDSEQGFVSETVLSNVRVLAVDQATEPAKGAQSLVGAVVTLEIPAPSVEAMARAKAGGNVMLALRSYADTAGAPGTGGPAGPSQSVRVFRAGAASEVMVSR